MAETCAGCAQVIDPPQFDRVLPVRLTDWQGRTFDFHDFTCVATWAGARDAEHKAAVQTHLQSTVDQIQATIEATTAFAADTSDPVAQASFTDQAQAAQAALPDAQDALSSYTTEAAG